MRKITAAAVALLAAILVAMTITPAEAAGPLVAGHRGTTNVPGYPDQSLKSIGYVKTYGGQIVEGDVRFTSDDYAVMAHDDKAPGCSGTISGRTFADLRTCSGSSVFPQMLFWLREAKRLGLTANVELKGHPTAHQYEVFARTVLAEGPPNVVVASFYPETLEAVTEILGDYRTGGRVRVAPIIAPTGSPFGYSVSAHAAKYDLILADFDWFIVDRVRWYRDAGVHVWFWTADDPAAITRCKALANASPSTTAIIADDVRKVTGL